MPWTLIQEISATEVSPLLVKKTNKSYMTLADVSDAKRRVTSPSSILLGRTGMLSMGDQPSPRTPTVA
jgi:hypothetical protein